MTFQTNQNFSVMPPEYFKNLYNGHWQGALVRAGASLIMWEFAVIAFYVGIIKTNHLAGVSAAVAYLILMNLPTLWALKGEGG